MCIAVYNGAPFVRRQLESITQQLQPGDEIVVIDDASTDDTPDIIEQLADPRTRVIRRTANGGAANAFVDAITRATGEVIFLADQDDLWLPGKVDAVLERIAAGNDVIVHDAVVVANGEVILPSMFASRHSRAGVLKNIARNSYTGCCLAFRSAIVPDILPMPETTLFFHDNWLGVAAELCGHRVEFLRRPLIAYTRHEANLTRRRPLPVIVRSRIVLVAHIVGFLLRRLLRRRRDGVLRPVSN